MKINEKITIAQIANLDGSGMCYVIHLSDGTFIIIDGGESDYPAPGTYDFNRDALMKHLKKLSGDKKPIISAWFITHFHLDHIDLATRLIKEQGDNFEIKAFFYNGPGSYEAVDESERFALWEDAMSCHPKASRRVMQSGEKYSFADVEVNVLMAEDFRYYKEPPSQNHICAALMFNFENGTKFAVLGDCDTERLYQLRVRDSAAFQPDENLRCDILQVPHHGLPLGQKEFIDKNLELLKVMEPKICFIPSSEERFLTDKKFFDNPFYSDNYYLITTRRESCFPCSTTAVVDIADLTVSFE